ncbi:MAG: Imm63 family immunity protein [Syntrophothermus sp.]
MNEKISLSELRKAVNEMAAKVNIPAPSLAYYFIPNQDAHPYIEIDNNGQMNYVISERGQEYQRNITDDPDELLYLLFENVTRNMASDYELANRKEGQDMRHILFSKQEELLGILNENWKKRKIEEHKQVIKASALRDSYCNKLRAKGFSEREIARLSLEKYPLS